MAENDQMDREDDGGRKVPLDRQTIRESILARIEDQRLEALREEKAERRKARKVRVEQRRAADVRKAKHRKESRLRAVNEANDRVRGNVAAASRSLRAALRAATAVPLPRHSDEGRAQQRTIRKIESAITSLRDVRVGTFDETKVEVDLDLDV
jgi:hypothetical protein